LDELNLSLDQEHTTIFSLDLWCRENIVLCVWSGVG